MCITSRMQQKYDNISSETGVEYQTMDLFRPVSNDNRALGKSLITVIYLQIF